jgi:signal recognition particle subunit SEC65
MPATKRQRRGGRITAKSLAVRMHHAQRLVQIAVDDCLEKVQYGLLWTVV